MSSLENGSLSGDGPPAIQLNRITRYFGTSKAVDEITFHVNRGEVFGYIGPNGAGKTTSMRILATLESPSSGEAWVDGFSVVDDPDRVRFRLGWMPDDFETYPDVNCEEYLDFFARSYGLRGKERRRSLRHVMGFTQLDQMANKPVDSLSKGMKQRLGLGRALIHNPSVLILDEPAAGLDPRARIELREMIGQLADEGKSMLVSSHILTELAEMCDRVGIIEKGRMLAVGSVDEILDSLHQADRDASDQSRRSSMFVETLNDPKTAMSWLSQQPEVDSVSLQGSQVAFFCSNEREQQSNLQSQMITAGIPVVSYGQRKATLEEAFLKVTKGRVQ